MEKRANIKERKQYKEISICIFLTKFIKIAIAPRDVETMVVNICICGWHGNRRPAAPAWYIFEWFICKDIQFSILIKIIIKTNFQRFSENSVFSNSYSDWWFRNMAPSFHFGVNLKVRWVNPRDQPIQTISYKLH